VNRRHIPVATLAVCAFSLFPFEENLHATPSQTPAKLVSTNPKQYRPDSLPHLTWADFFAKVESTGATYSDRLKELDGHRVVLKGNAVLEPRPEGGLYLTRNPEARLHPDDEDTLPWDSVGVLWRKSVRVPRIPSRPSIEGTLRVGNRQVGTETVILVLEDAIPHVEKSGTAPIAKSSRPSAPDGRP
jgi:hypothetical protein